MWRIARIGQGKHQKALEQEIWRVHNSNPLQRHKEHVHAAIVLNTQHSAYSFAQNARSMIIIVPQSACTVCKE